MKSVGELCSKYCCTSVTSRGVDFLTSPDLTVYSTDPYIYIYYLLIYIYILTYCMESSTYCTTPSYAGVLIRGV